MIEIPDHPKYVEWAARSFITNCFPCVICGKAIEKKNVKHRVYMHNDGEHLLSIEEAKITPELYEELGMWPIGSDCISQHPKLQGYVVAV